MNVAVPSPNTRPCWDNARSSQMVCSLCSDTMLRTSLYASPVGSLTRNHLGLGALALGDELLEDGGVADIKFVVL